jgi:hypothetical protein
MSLPWFWDCLDLTPAAGTRDVKRRYSQLLKLNRPEDNPQGFQQLRAAYEICLRLAREREEAGDAEPLPAQLQPQVETASQPQTETAPQPQAGTAAQAAARPQPPPDAEAEPQPQPAAPLRIEDEPPRTPLQRPATHVGSDPPPAPLQKVDASHIGKFIPVGIEPPRLRPAAAVVDELLHLDATDPVALPQWFGRCPELVNFEARDAVELALLQRIAAGARPGLATLNQASDEFGWRELGFARRLAARGISGAQWQVIDNALHQAFAEGQFITHMAQGQRLLDEVIGLNAEKRLLQRLHAQRGRRPSLWQAFMQGQVMQVNNLLRAYADRYGGRALYHVFGAPFLDFWRNVHPGSQPNWLRFRLLVLRVVTYLLPAWLGLMTLLQLAAEAGTDDPGTMQPQVVFSVLFALLTLVLIGYGGTSLALQHFQDQIWPRYAHWRDALLARYVEPWLKPLRAVPLLLALGGLLALLHQWPGDMAGAVLCAAIALTVFGLTGLIALGCAALFLCGAVLGWEPADPPWAALAGSGGLGLVWAADRLSVHAPRRWVRRFGLTLVFSFFALLGSGLVHDLVGR